ncbi:O-antigen ligase family protein [Labrys sp. 22185]|uniref:O-antigen ligase family protein n=1 Tax=Labrys sp. 22185 TaxID=3453888 RepID=UPI003F83166A
MTSALAALRNLASGLGLVVLAAAACGIAAGAAVSGDLMVLGCLACAAAVPFALVFIERASAWDGRQAYRMIIILTIALSAVVRLRAIDDKSIDAQILVKLLAIGLTGLMAAAAFPRIGLQRHSQAFFVWCAFLVYTMMTSFLTATPALSLVETTSNLAAFLLLYSAAHLLNRDNLVKAMVASCFILCLLSLAAYGGMPSLGRMSDWVNGAFVPTWRLQGVFGTANAAGGAAAIGIILTLLLSRGSRSHPLDLMLLGVFLVCLILSNNRMAMAGLAATLLYASWASGNKALKLAVFALAVGIIILIYLGTGDELLEFLSRSGSPDEITSGTGRSRIWAVVLELWSEQPLLGYGAGSAKYILPKNPLLFTAAAHAHNLFLNVLFSGGLVGLLLFGWGLVLAMRQAIGGKEHGVFALLIFFMVYGITEPTIGGLVSFVPMAFYTAIVLAIAPSRDRGADEARDGRYAQGASLKAASS